MNNLSAGTQGLMQGMGFNGPDLSSWNQAVNSWRQKMAANNYSYNWYQPPRPPVTAPATTTAAAALSQQMTRQRKARYQIDR